MTWLIRFMVLNSVQSSAFAFLGIVLNFVIDFCCSVGMYPVYILYCKILLLF